MTPRALVCAIAGIGLVTVGVVTEAPALFVFGCALILLIVIVALLMGRAPTGSLYGTRPALRVPRGTDATMVFRFELTGSRRWIFLTSGDVKEPNVVIAANPSMARLNFSPDTSRRGTLNLGPFTIVQLDPWGFVRRPAATAPRVSVNVHPRIRKLKGPLAAVAAELAESSLSAQRGDEHFVALRDYVLGDDPRTIHWRSSARVGDLVVRESVAPASRATTIVLDVDSTAYIVGSLSTVDPGPELFEQTVDLVASLAAAASVSGDVFVTTTRRGAAIFAASRDSLGEVLDGLTPIQRCTPLQTAPEELKSAIRRTRASRIVIVSGSAGHRTVPAVAACATSSAGVIYIRTMGEGRPKPSGVRTIDFDVASEFS